MTEKVIQISDSFWNIRGSFRAGGLIDVGTQVSLVKRSNGKYVFLDSYSLTDEMRDKVNQLTDNGRLVEAVINLHPFHTLHVTRMHELFPEAKLYGTARHLTRFPELPWEDTRSEDTPLHESFAEDFEFSLPEGVDFVSVNEQVHFSSVLALHKASKTIHVDDTLMFSSLPAPARLMGVKDRLSFHPTLALALQKRGGAAEEFRHWAESLLERWGGAENICAAHTAPLLAARNSGRSIRDRLRRAIDNIGWLLRAHKLRYG